MWYIIFFWTSLSYALINLTIVKVFVTNTFCRCKDFSMVLRPLCQRPQGFSDIFLQQTNNRQTNENAHYSHLEIKL